MEHILLGQRGEEAAANYLEDKGYYIKARNFRTSLGEIDLIAEKEEALIFVEVKTRKGLAYGRPSEAVDYRKQQKILTVAQQFLQLYKLFHKKIRFDVIEVLVDKERISDINHIQNAFTR